MPRRDGTGPLGEGAGSGRGLGTCGSIGTGYEEGRYPSDDYGFFGRLGYKLRQRFGCGRGNQVRGMGRQGGRGQGRRGNR